jgi:hypothetical protein
MPVATSRRANRSASTATMTRAVVGVADPTAVPTSTSNTGGRSNAPAFYMRRESLLIEQRHELRNGVPVADGHVLVR